MRWHGLSITSWTVNYSKSVDISSYSTLTILTVVKDHVILLTVGVFADRWGDFLRSAIGPSYSADRLEKMEKTAEEYAMKILEEATKVINEHSSKLNKSAQISHEIYALKTGDARDVIVDFCKDTNADVLVMGSRGLGALKRTMGVGSTSDYCVHNAPCPVIIVKQK